MKFRLTNIPVRTWVSEKYKNLFRIDIDSLQNEQVFYYRPEHSNAMKYSCGAYVYRSGRYLSLYWGDSKYGGSTNKDQRYKFVYVEKVVSGNKPYEIPINQQAQ